LLSRNDFDTLPINREKVTTRGRLDQHDRHFNPDSLDRPIVAGMVDTQEKEDELAVHTHRKGQLVLVQRGGVIYEVPSGLWMVPPRCGVWIPGGMPHSNRVPANAGLLFLYVDMEAANVPQECCTLSITPLLHELIHRMATLRPLYNPQGPTAQIAMGAPERADRHAGRKAATCDHATFENALYCRFLDGQSGRPPDRGGMGGSCGARRADADASRGHRNGHDLQALASATQIIVAIQKLSAGETVQSVSGALGCESVSAFITMFKKVLGKSPARYFSEREADQTRHLRVDLAGDGLPAPPDARGV
jgi:hypothetical protein